MAKDARVPMRLPEALKQAFEQAAVVDGCRGVSTWLRMLGEQRLEELSYDSGPPMTMKELRDAQRAINAHMRAHLALINGDRPAEPAAEFVPGFGLDEE